MPRCTARYPSNTHVRCEEPRGHAGDHFHSFYSRRWENVPAAHMGRDWAGRLMACTIPGPHRGRKHVAEHGGTLRPER